MSQTENTLVLEQKNRLNIGISKCLLGENVRYDGNNKRLEFAVMRLQPYANYLAICPEMAIGLPSPRPTLGLYRLRNQQIIIRFNESRNDAIDEQIRLFSQQTITKLSTLCGYIVCAKSPSCGLNNAKLLDNDSLEFISFTDGIFTAHLRDTYPWLPIIDNQQLMDSESQDHFMIRVFALHKLNQLKNKGLNRNKLLEFHSRYKLLLLAHSQPLYRQLGPFVAKIAEWDNLDDFFIEYRNRLMLLLAQPATRENHTNVLMHMQGYFNRYLTADQKKSFTDTILSYHQGQTSLQTVISCIKSYLIQYPNKYLSEQYYFVYYPEPLPK
ncbi:YbgA family protein [Orbus mooreae]|uniref:YbgA family protein n=1 Tax=Orbus mooreae TaxID=3074107 RepID=UPI00370D88A9